MDYATALARLERMTQYQTAPALTSAELADLLLQARRTDASGYTFYDTWAAATPYRANEYRVPTSDNGFYYIVQTAGTSGGAQPAWPTTIGDAVTDGTVVWRNAGQFLWTPTYDLGWAAGEGWLWKAGKASASFDVASAGDKLSLKQQYDMCMAMAASYGRVTVGGGGSIGGGGGMSSVRLATATTARVS